MPKYLLPLLVVFAMNASAQVQNSAYNVLLQTLLSHSVEEVSVAQASTRTNAWFVDAREKNEFAVSRIKNVVHIGYGHVDLTAVRHLPKEDTIILYCSVGYRSEQIAEKLKTAGYTHVMNLYGGIFEWVNQGYPLTDANGHKTNRVHAYSNTWSVWLSKGVKVYD